MPFKAPLRNEYDAVIHLMAENIPCREYPLFIASDKNSKKRKHINELKGSSRKYGRRFRVETYRNISSKEPLDRLIFGFDPVNQYVRKLREAFGHLAYFSMIHSKAM